jgi:acyl carrier protein
LPFPLISNLQCGVNPSNVQSFNEFKMERSEIQKRVKEVVGNVLEIDSSEIADDANFIFDLGADSMQSLELVAGFEEEFNVELDEDKALEVQNLDDAVDFISGYLK